MNDAAVPTSTFPRVLRKAWRESDAASRCLRRCDALNRDTVQRKLSTLGGDYWLCGETGLFTRDKFEMQISDFYDEWWSRPLPEEERRAKIDKCKAALKVYEPYRKTGRLFEVGSGMGLLLNAAAELGWHVEGNELSPKAAEAAQQSIGATVRPGPIEDVELPEGAFDVILLDNVFEHLWRPREVLCRLSRALRPGGVLFMHTLNAQSFSLRVRPKDWLYFRVTHFHVPTLVSLRHYFDAAGLRILRQSTHGFRMRPLERDKNQSKAASLVEKIVSAVAGRCNRGHRVELLLERPE